MKAFALLSVSLILTGCISRDSDSGVFELPISCLACEETLQVMGEKDLSLHSTEKSEFLIRVLVVPTFQSPVMLRYERVGNQIHFRATKLSGMGGYNLGHIEEDITETFSSTKIQELLDVISKFELGRLPPRDEYSGLDGIDLWLEVIIDGRYYSVKRWSPESDSNARFITPIISFYTQKFRKIGFWTD